MVDEQEKKVYDTSVRNITKLINNREERVMKRGLTLILALAITAAMVSGCGNAASGQGSGEERESG